MDDVKFFMVIYNCKDCCKFQGNIVGVMFSINYIFFNNKNDVAIVLLAAVINTLFNNIEFQ